LFLCEYDDEDDAEDKHKKCQCKSWAEAKNGKWGITEFHVTLTFVETINLTA